MKRRAVVTGIGAVTSLGCRVEELWTRICNGESGIRALQRFDLSSYRAQIGGEILDWSTDGYISSKEAKRIDRFAQLGLVSSMDAVKDSGIDFSREDPYRCGVILGSGVGGLREIEIQHTRLLAKGPSKVSPFTVPKMMANAASGQVSIVLGLRGPNTTVVTACASATNAIGDALRVIQYGHAEVVITGGAEAAVTPLGLSAFASMRALSERNDDPAAASRPFDKDRDGFVLGEGAGTLVLEEIEHAKARRANIYAELLGYGATADGTHITQPDENGVGATRAMLQGLEDARLDPAQIDYINAHGTSTPLGDRAETVAIKSVFNERAREVSISSTKSQLGHLLGASGGVELVFCVLALRDGVIPPTINYQTPDPLCDLDYTPNQARQRKVSVAMSNSFGFGGHNGSLIVGLLDAGA